MPSPETARALPELVAAGVLTPERAAPLLAAARGEIVSVRGELRALLGVGVAALTAGVGLFLKEHHEALGPATIAGLLTLAATTVFFALARRAPPFSWTRSEIASAPPPAVRDGADWIVDGLLILALSLLGADLAWIELQFTPLGAEWSWHLLLMSVVTAALAVRFDSIPGWTVALSTFAAWRGVSLRPSARQIELFLGWRQEELLRANLLLCAVVFALLAWVAVRAQRKPQFEPATTLLAALAAGSAFASGLGESALWPLWTAALVALGLGVARFAFARRRLGLFALGALAVYVGVTRCLFEAANAFALGCFWFAGSTVGAIALLYGVHRRFQGDEAARRTAAAHGGEAPESVAVIEASAATGASRADSPEPPR